MRLKVLETQTQMEIYYIKNILHQRSKLCRPENNFWGSSFHCKAKEMNTLFLRIKKCNFGKVKAEYNLIFGYGKQNNLYRKRKKLVKKLDFGVYI